MFKRSASRMSLALLCWAVAAVAQSSPNESLPAGPSAAGLIAGSIKDTASAACLACHEARIIVQQRISKAAWTKEMDKMIKWGADVDPKDRDALIDYFSSNFGPEQPSYNAPKSTRAPRGSGKARH